MNEQSRSVNRPVDCMRVTQGIDCNSCPGPGCRLEQESCERDTAGILAPKDGARTPTTTRMISVRQCVEEMITRKKQR